MTSQMHIRLLSSFDTTIRIDELDLITMRNVQKKYMLKSKHKLNFQKQFLSLYFINLCIFSVYWVSVSSCSIWLCTLQTCVYSQYTGCLCHHVAYGFVLYKLVYILSILGLCGIMQYIALYFINLCIFSVYWVSVASCTIWLLYFINLCIFSVYWVSVVSCSIWLLAHIFLLSYLVYILVFF